ncbi:serine hydrolase [Kangiella sediminilitoris]|uniref:Beta-lactamase n=1 Tax=Kangiella sediminilitoris TaxID=1144748 RepID=A0A1B3B7U5_9GAMM|nr:serine hydrolase [Kangiella sediminilitoris]AOE48858.1 Beta-lactamase [Kangiella sediminilitoris]
MWNKIIKATNALVVVLCLIGLANISLAEAREKGPKKAQMLQTELDPYFETLAKSNRFIGEAAIYQSGNELYHTTIEPDGEQSILTDKHYKYKVGSITKTYTATVILQLIEENRLSLDTKLSEYYPNVANAGAITVEQLLTHHSGIHNYTADADFLTYHEKPQSKTFLLDKIESFKPDFNPGEKAQYSNSNYLLLGYIIEDIEGKSYQDVLLERIIEPLGLDDTFVGEAIDPENEEAYSYQLAEKWNEIPEWDMSVAFSAGAIVSTPEELDRFISALFKGKLISDSSLKKMINIENGFGKGIFETKYEWDDKELQGYWHNGGIEGFISHLAYYPDEDLTIVVLSNGLNYDIRAIYNVMLDAYFEQDFDTPEFGKAVEVPVSELEKYTGKYESKTHPLDITVSLLGNKLYGQATGQGGFPLTPLGEGRFEFAKAGIEIRFDDNNNQFEIKQGGRADIFNKVEDTVEQESVEVPIETLKQYVGIYQSESFPLDLEVMIKDGYLHAQATGQPAFPLTAVSQYKFKFDMASIVIEFRPEQSELTITQRGMPRDMYKK